MAERGSVFNDFSCIDSSYIYAKEKADLPEDALMSLFGKQARAPTPSRGGPRTGRERRVAEIEPSKKISVIIHTFRHIGFPVWSVVPGSTR